MCILSLMVLNDSYILINHTYYVTSLSCVEINLLTKTKRWTTTDLIGTELLNLKPIANLCF